MARPGIHVPRGFQYDGRLDGGGFEMAAMLVIRGHYGPIRRFRIQRARRTGDLRSAARLLLRNADAFDFDEWDGRLLEGVVGALSTAAGLPCPAGKALETGNSGPAVAVGRACGEAAGEPNAPRSG